jgi:hypothetical protein
MMVRGPFSITPRGGDGCVTPVMALVDLFQK